MKQRHAKGKAHQSRAKQSQPKQRPTAVTGVAAAAAAKQWDKRSLIAQASTAKQSNTKAEQYEPNQLISANTSPIS